MISRRTLLSHCVLAGCVTALPFPSAAWSLVASADDAVATLIAKGAKFKKDKAGVPTEINFGTGSTLSADDWKLVGQIKTLTRAWTSTSKEGTVPLTDDLAASLSGLENLEHFFSNGSEMTDDGFRAFASWKKLKHFGLDHWFGPKPPPGTKQTAYVGGGLIHLKELPNLESVRLGGCRVDNAAPKALAEAKTLQSVDLFHTFAVTDEGVAHLKALPKLRIIKLGPQFTTRITDATLQHLGQIPTLEEIHITETWHTYENGFAHLKGLKNLKLLKLPNVLATEADIAKLKADHPNATVEWTLPDEASTAKLKSAHERLKAGKK